MPVVKIFALTRGVHAPRPYGQPDGCPIPLSCGIVLELKQKQAFFKGLLPYPYVSINITQIKKNGNSIILS